MKKFVVVVTCSNYGTASQDWFVVKASSARAAKNTVSKIVEADRSRYSWYDNIVYGVDAVTKKKVTAISDLISTACSKLFRATHCDEPIPDDDRYLWHQAFYSGQHLRNMLSGH